LIRPSFKRPAQTIACVNYMIAVFNETYNEKRQLFLSAET
jgi:hypothetical protein